MCICDCVMEGPLCDGRKDLVSVEGRVGAGGEIGK